MLCMVTTALAQTKVTGTVLSQEDGEPVIGATVMVQGDKRVLSPTSMVSLPLVCQVARSYQSAM